MIHPMPTNKIRFHKKLIQNDNWGTKHHCSKIKTSIMVPLSHWLYLIIYNSPITIVGKQCHSGNIYVRTAVIIHMLTSYYSKLVTNYSLLSKVFSDSLLLKVKNWYAIAYPLFVWRSKIVCLTSTNSLAHFSISSCKTTLSLSLSWYL